MAEDGKLYIVITDRRPDAGSGFLGVNGAEKEDKTNKDRLKSYMADHFFSLIEGTVKETVNFTVSHIGDFTGNYQQQRELQAGISLVNRGLSIGKAAVAGYIATGGGATGIIGALIGVTVSVARQGIQLAEEHQVAMAQTVRNQHEIDLLRKRSGLNSLSDGSRGTMD